MANYPQETTGSEEWTPKQQKQILAERLSMLASGDEKISFTHLPSDVVVAVPPKCGTTWVLHICHQIRTKGAEPDFDYQTDVVGWLEKGRDLLGIDPATLKQPAQPRIFFTHVYYPLVPKGGKHIYCFRDQKDVLVSAYYFLDSNLILRGRVSLPNLTYALLHSGFVEKRLKDLLIWWEHRHDEDMLLLFYDDLKEDHAGCVARIAKFMGVDCDKEDLARVVCTTTHADMVRYHRKFNMHKMVMSIAKEFGEDLELGDSHVGRVRKDGGRSGDGCRLPLEMREYIDRLWQEIVNAKLGFSNLKEMRETWHKELHDGLGN